MPDVLRLDAAASGDVNLANYVVSAGTNRGLIIGYAAEGPITPGSVTVTWGTQILAEIGTVFVDNGANDLELTLFLLLEADIASASSTQINFTAQTPNFTFHIASFENVNQGGGAATIPETNSDSTLASTPNPLTGSDIVAGDGAAVIALAGAGNVATAAWGADLTEQTEQDDASPTMTGSLADGLFPTGQNVNVEATWSVQNRAAVLAVELAPSAGNLSGAIALALAPTGNLSAVIPIAGTIPLTITPTAELSGGPGPEVWYKQAKVTVPASGNSVIDVTDKGTIPFGVHVSWAINTINQVRQNDYTFGHGFAAAANQRAIMHNAEQNASNNHRASTDTASILIKNPVNDDVLVAATITFQATTITVVYSIQLAGYRLNFDIFGGVDGAAVVGDVGADDQEITGLGLANGDLLMMSTSGEQIPASSQFAYQSFGVSHDNGVSIDQWGLLAYAGDNDVDFKGSALVEGLIAGQYDVDFANWTINILTQTGDGATWAGSNVDHVAFMMIDFGGHGVDVGVFTKATAAAPAAQNLPDLGFRPQGYGLATASEILQTIDVDRPCRQSYGAFDGDGAAGLTGRSAIGTSANQVNTDSYTFSDDESVLMTSQRLDNAAVPDARAKASSIMSQTPEITWEPNTATADFIGYWAVQQREVVDALIGTIPLSIDATAALRADAAISGTAALTLTPVGTIRGIGDLAGDLTLLITPTGQLVAASAIAGVIPLTITPTGTLQARGALAGSSDLVITPTATIQAIAALAGAIPLIITPTGIIVARGDLAGSADMVITPAGQLVGLGALAGTVDLVVTPTGTIQAVGALAGSAALVLTPAGAIRGAGPLSGTVAMVLTPDGTLVGVGALAGSAALLITPAGTIQARGDLAGVAALTITPAGALGSLGELSGAVALLLTPTATLGATGALLGTAALVITPTGNLGTTGGNLAGVIPLTLTATATLEALAAIAGAATLIITPSGTLQATGGLLGTAALTITLAGNLAALGELLGTSDLVLTPSGTIVGQGELAGTIPLELTPAAILAAIGELTGSSDLVLTPAGILGGMQLIAGTIPLSITPAGTLAGQGALAGSAALVITPTGNVQSTGVLSGVIPLTLDLAGALVARGALAGGLTLTLTPTGTIVATGALAGGATLIMTPTATAQAIGELTGAIDIVIDAAGTMVAKALAEGSINLTLTPTGVASGTARIQGTAALSISPAGTLRGIGDLVGLAELALSLTAIIFDQGARRIPNSLQSLLVFLENSRQDLASGTASSIQTTEGGTEFNSVQSLSSPAANSSQ